MKNKINFHATFSILTGLTLFFLIFILFTASAVTAQTSSPAVTETRITTHQSAENPVIYGDNIVWQDNRNGNWDIYIYNLSTRKEIHTINRSNQISPDIYGDKVVWQDNRTGNEDIFFQNLSIKKQVRITKNESNQYSPAIYKDKIVWVDGRNGGCLDEYGNSIGSVDIYMFNLSSNKETRITTSGAATNPDIYENIIVWQDHRDKQYDSYSNIYMFDLSTMKETQITTSELAISPAIYGDKIVWEDARNWTFGDIYMYNLSTSTESQISNSSRAYNPAIYGDRIVYEDNRYDASGNTDLFMYDLFTNKEILLTAWDEFQGGPDDEWSDEYQVDAAIYEDRIVWAGGYQGSYDIYLGTPLSNLPEAAFLASPISGKVPLKVQFSDKSTSAPTSWKWSFGDKTYSTQKNPKHTYSKPGKYTVSLTVKNAAGNNTKTVPGYIVVKK
ncbi:MAG: PKD domain-containing protein [Methanosarcina sp.]